MATISRLYTRDHGVLAVVLRSMILCLTLATAWIHSTLGGALFTLNAIGYTTLAIAMILPGPIARIRWLVRLALMAFALATIVGWLAFGARFSLAYIDKAIEVVLVGFLAAEVWLDGGPAGIARHVREVWATVHKAPAAAALTALPSRSPAAEAASSPIGLGDVSRSRTRR